MQGFFLWSTLRSLNCNISFDYVIETACIQTITILYMYLCVWRLNLRLNNIIHQSLFFIINIYHYCHYYWTSKSLINLWEYTQGSNITNKWVVHFVILCVHFVVSGYVDLLFLYLFLYDSLIHWLVILEYDALVISFLYIWHFLIL